MLIADIVLPAALVPVLFVMAAGWATYVTRQLWNIKIELHSLKVALGVAKPDNTPTV